ncbi:MAG: 4a-hydroxytetrahydrobiopterin dehydratase [Crocinitomicaceae bacterium]|jgi:4a-hydroxytetrahydrobiopterin dehydratase|nr:4a-hydroxytetrahydrobiopterin dehydratase [Crocinitomicaceae bacterium]MDG1734942.1 4a-hydroxytetrahydrobiopterin dehydratase [Crocinitomicaceae bacterium]
MNWEEIDGKLVRNLKCQDFEEAVALFNEIAVIAESMNHHPDLRIYSYKFLSIEIYTHDKNSITPKDYELAEEIDIILK